MYICVCMHIHKNKLKSGNQTILKKPKLFIRALLFDRSFINKSFLVPE